MLANETLIEWRQTKKTQRHGMNITIILLSLEKSQNLWKLNQWQRTKQRHCWSNLTNLTWILSPNINCCKPSIAGYLYNQDRSKWTMKKAHLYLFKVNIDGLFPHPILVFFLLKCRWLDFMRLLILRTFALN